jgi:hypothetical protein
VVRDGNLITSGGVTSGIDFGLSVLAAGRCLGSFNRFSSIPIAAPACDGSWKWIGLPLRRPAGEKGGSAKQPIPDDGDRAVPVTSTAFAPASR